jgi:hypothetical protein
MIWGKGGADDSGGLACRGSGSGMDKFVIGSAEAGVEKSPDPGGGRGEELAGTQPDSLERQKGGSQPGLSHTARFRRFGENRKDKG